MTRQRQFSVLAILIVALGLIGYFIQTRGGAGAHDMDADGDEDADAVTAPKSAGISHTPNGDPILQVDPATQSLIGLRTAVLTSQQLQPQLTAYGALEEDPSRTFVLRAPIAGILRYARGRGWPSIGEHLADGAVIGMIQPRFTAAEQISLTSQLTTAKSELAASTASASAARSAYLRTKILNADNKNVSDQVLQDAAARLQAEEAHLKAAQQTERQIEAALQSADPADSRKLVVERGGEVVDLIAQPGESIEPGSPILRVTKLDRLLARIDIPVGEHIPAAVTTARIVPVGFENRSIPAIRIGVAIASGTSMPGQGQGEAFLFRLAKTSFGLRPGVAVTAYIELDRHGLKRPTSAGSGPTGQMGSPQTGVIVPQAAVVRFGGSGFAYVQTSPNEFVRKQLPLDRSEDNGYFTTENFRPGDRVVVAGAQSLLSQEFKSQIRDTD